MTFVTRAHARASRVLIGIAASICVAILAATPAHALSGADLVLALAPAVAVTVDGTIAANEYGVHINGQNQQGTSSSQIWYMTWDATNLYVAISASNTAEAAVLYLDKNPLTPINGGTNADGTAVGFNYDGASFANLQSRADLVVYFKDGYREHRTANGANGWSAATATFGSYASNSGAREVAIPWVTIGGKPASFAWFGYLTSSGGFVYAPVPTENGTGPIGTVARYERYYIVNNTTIGSETKPFSRNSYVFNNLADETGFGTIGTWDFTMNSAGRTITRGTGAWTIGGDLRVDAGTVGFGATPDAANISGNVSIAAGATVTLSTAIGGDLNVAGNWSNAGTFNPASRAVGLNGAAIQTLTGATTFDYLSLNNPTELQLNSDATVNQQLTLTNGKVRTGANKLIIGASATLTGGGAARYVIGNLQKPIIVAAGSATQTFEVGDASAYAPASVSFAGTATTSGSILASTAVGDHSQIASSGLNATRTANRTWTMQNVGVGFTSCKTTFNFVPGDLDAGAQPANFAVRRWTGSAWQPATAGVRTATSTEATGVTAFGDFQLGELLTHTIMASAQAGATISPSGPVTVNHFANQTFTFHADACHILAGLVIDGVPVSVAPDTSYTFSNVQADHAIQVVTTLRSYAIAVSSGAGGAITPSPQSGSVSVSCAGSAAFAIAADAGYRIADVLVDGASIGAASSYTFTSVTSNHAIAATFAINVYTITASAEPGTMVSPSGAVAVNHGADQTFTFHADDCHFVEAVIADGGGSQTSDSTYTFADVQANHTLSIVAGVKLERIYTAAGPGGAVLPSSAPLGFLEVPCDGSQSLAIVADAGYHIADVRVDGASIGAASSYAFTNVTANHTLAASFTLNVYTITASAGAGATIAPAGAVAVNHGADQAFTVSTDDCHFIQSVIVDGGSVGAFASYTFANVQADHSIAVVAGTTTYTVTATAGPHGQIAQSGAVDYACGSSPAYTITADTGYAVADVVVDGASQGAQSSWVFADLHAAHTLSATFTDAAPPTVQVIAPNGGESFGLSEPIELQWNATDNTGVASVDLLLSRTGPTGPYETIAANQSNTGTYTWTATVPTTNDAWFRVVARDSAAHTTTDTSDAAFSIHGPTATPSATITEFALAAITPNPAHSRARVAFELPRAAHVRIDVLDVQGRQVGSLVDADYPAGRHTIEGLTKTGHPLPAGLYLVRMATPNHVFVKRALLLP